MGDTIPLLIAIIALVILSAFFSSSETAFSCVNRVKLRTMATAGNKRAQRVLTLAEGNYDKLITTLLVGNNIVNLTAATLSTLFFAKILSGSTVDSGVISTAVLTITVLIFGEITPKFIAKTYPEKLSMTSYPIVMFFYYLFYPFNFLFSGWKWLIGKIFRLKNDEIITEEEIMTVVEEAEEDGTIKQEETELIRSVFEFDDLEVGDILVPRVNVSAVEQGYSMDSIRRVFETDGYSRLVVYKETIDTVVGTIHEKDFYVAYLNGKKNIANILQPAVYTTEHTKISQLLKTLQKKKTHMAVVLDEYGGTLGIVTLEDILEELVGEIWDEHDEEENFFKPLDENTTLIMGTAPLSDVFERFSILEENEEFDAITIGGFVLEQLGKIPLVGESFEYSGYKFEVAKATIKRILQVKLTKI